MGPRDQAMGSTGPRDQAMGQRDQAMGLRDQDKGTVRTRLRYSEDQAMGTVGARLWVQWEPGYGYMVQGTRCRVQYPVPGTGTRTTSTHYRHPPPPLPVPGTTTRSLPSAKRSAGQFYQTDKAGCGF